MKTSFNRHLIAFAFGIGFFSWQSCKERTVTKTDLIPDVDNIHTFRLPVDSLDATLDIGVFDSVRTNQYDANSSPLMALGNIQSDPFFGSFSAGIFTQFTPPTANFHFPSASDATFDSAVLALPYYGFTYGDTLNPSGNLMSYNVYRVTEPMSLSDSDVYTFTDYTFDPTPIGEGTASFKSLTDTFASGKDTLSRQLRIKLDKNYIYSNIITADTSNFSNSKNFLSYFNGWYIAPEENQTSSADRVSYFTLAATTAKASARVDFFFHDADNAIKIYSFPYGSVISAFVSRIKKDYSGKPVQNFINAPINRDSILLQGTPGVYSNITLRHLNQMPACIVNQAELVLTAIPVGQDDIFPTPPHLILEKVTPSGAIVPIADVFGSDGSPSSGGLNFMGGTPEEVSINGQTFYQYKLNFPRELQKTLLAGEDSITFRITASSIYQGAFRMVAPGFNAPNEAKMKLNIIYTKLK